MEYYILFENQSSGMLLKKFLDEKNIPFTITPTPRKLSTCCGISMKINKENINQINNILDENTSIKSLGIKELDKSNEKKLFDF